MSPGSNAGTGHPLWFKCRACRAAGAHGVTLTGRKRRRDAWHKHIRADFFAREYRCTNCGHIGWSRHVDLAQKEASR